MEMLPIGAFETLPAPPPSPGKRRRSLRASDDSSGDMEIENWLCEIDPFRSTNAKIPYPLPVKRTGPIISAERFVPLKAQIEDVMLRHNITDRYIAQICNTSKPSYPNGTMLVPTVLVRFVEATGLSTSWSDARDELAKLMCAEKYPSADIEFIDMRRARMPSIFPLAPQSEAIRVYRDVRDELIELLYARLGNAWNCMSCFKFGRSLDKAVPTVVVYVRPFTKTDWKTLEIKMKEIISPAVPRGLHLPVEFIPGQISHPQLGKDLSKTSLSNPLMGSSIGLCGVDSSGTLGGFVTLKIGKKTHHGFLTTHHVVRPVGSDGQLENHIARFGYEYRDGKPHVAIQFPSHEDLQATRAQLQTNIHRVTELADELKRKQEEREEMGLSPLAKQVEARKSQLENINHEQQKLNNLAHLPLNLGRVLVSSGQGISDQKSIIDWAFVEVPEAVIRSSPLAFSSLNKLPSITELELEFKELGRYEVAYGGSRNPDRPFYADDFGSIEPGQWYFKSGRTSGITAGLCNGIEADINREGQGYRFLQSDLSHAMARKCTREFIILSFKSSKDVYVHEMEQVRQSEFSEPGDSGSFVINGDGYVCGLLYGEHTGLCGQRDDLGAGLVTSMDEVRASIAFKTRTPGQNGATVNGELLLPSVRFHQT